LRDDRLELYLSPSFPGGPVHPVDVSLRKGVGNHDSLLVQVVTNLNYDEVTGVDLYVPASPTVVGSTSPRPWGSANQLFAYQPLLVDFNTLCSAAMRDSLAQRGLLIVFRRILGDIYAVVPVTVQTVDVAREQPGASGLQLLGARPNPFTR